VELIYQTTPTVTLSTNTFINVPTILQFDDTPLISIVKEENLGFTSEIPIFHADGTYLAKVRGTRVFPTEAGKKAGIVMRNLPNLTACELDGRTLFEIAHQQGDAFRAQAELYTPNGYFIKSTQADLPSLLKSDGTALNVGGIKMTNCSFSGVRIGIWLKSNGSIGIGCN
jgi:hypothetical protein